MKKILFFIFLSAITMLASAQKLRINGYANYVFDDDFDSYYSSDYFFNGQIDGGFKGGVGLEYMLSPQNCIELMWLHRSTHAPVDFTAGVANIDKFVNFDVKHDYILLGSDGHMISSSGKVEGYGGLFGGVLIANVDNPDNGDEGSATKFAWHIRLGCNIWATDRIGIKLQTQLTSSIRSTGGEVYFGPYGYPIGASAYSTLYQFGLGGGLTFTIGK